MLGSLHMLKFVMPSVAASNAPGHGPAPQRDVGNDRLVMSGGGVGHVLQDDRLLADRAKRRRGRQSPFMLSWFQQMDKARDAGEVVDIARDYLATWTPGELARLPRGCRPGRMRAPSDIEYLHACAVDAYRT